VFNRAPHRLAHLLTEREAARGVAHGFESEAERDHAKSIEAEHMLLALAASDTPAGRVLNEAGLNHERLAAAIRDEHRRSLAFAGVTAPDEDNTLATEVDGPVSMGTSAKVAVRRALLAQRESGHRLLRLASTDLLIGILQAELGTVPRALAIAGVDRLELIARVRGAR
jgi:ATP-dependent Clp protease ATP-binding subunit ClpA